MKTKIALALTMIGLSSIVTAGTPGNNMATPTGTPLIAPDSTGTWSFGLEALYMESNTQFQYAAVTNISSDTSLTETELNNESVSNDQNWGGEVDVSYIFPGSTRDISASYTHLNLDGSDSVDSSGSDLITSGVNNRPQAGVLISGFLSTTINSASASIDQDLNTATLTFGQFFSVGDRVSLHPFGGLQFADLDTTNKATYNGNIIATPTFLAVLDPTSRYTANYKNTTDFEGIGPRVGMDANIRLGGNFSIVGTLAGALLIGNMSSEFEQHYPTTIASFGFIPVDPITAADNENENDSYTAVVPELDAKLGIDFVHDFTPETSMNIQLGYEVAEYFNAESDDFIDANNVNSVNNTTNVSYNGPYLRLQLNVA